MTSYPVIFDTTRPEKFDRTQVVIRILVVLLLSILAGAFGWLLGIVYLAIPVIAAILISQKGAEGYLGEKGGVNMTLLQWYFAIYSYLLLLTDRFPTDNPQNEIRFEVTPTGSPTVGSALLRLIFSIPSAIVVGILGIAGFVVLIIAVISVLIQEQYSEGLYNFQLGIMRWQARLMGYHASLVDEYPPFALDTGHDESAPAATMDAAPAPPAAEPAPPPPPEPAPPPPSPEEPTQP
jgi:hypothetical protein